MFSSITRTLKPQQAIKCYRSIAYACNTQKTPYKQILQQHKIQRISSHTTSKTRCFSQEKTQSTCFEVVDAADYRKRVLQSTVPIVVDFHASWCGPCKVLGPLLEAAVDAHNGKVLLAKVDVDVNAEVAMEYEVSAVPTVLGIVDGLTEDQFMGSRPREEVEDFIHKLMEKK